MSNDKTSNIKVRELLERGIELEKLHRPGQATLCFSRILEIEPNNIDAISHIYKIFRRYRTISCSVKNLEFMNKITKNNPNNTDAWSALGWAYQNQKQISKAKKCYEKVREIESNGSPTKK